MAIQELRQIIPAEGWWAWATSDADPDRKSYFRLVAWGMQPTAKAATAGDMRVFGIANSPGDDVGGLVDAEDLPGFVGYEYHGDESPKADDGTRKRLASWG